MKNILILVGIILLIIIGIKIFNTNSVPAGLETATVQDAVVNTENASTTNQFEIKNPSLKITGFGPAGKKHEFSFDSISYSKLSVDENNNPVDGQVIVELSSVNTGITGLDNHLKSEDFFSVEQFPQAVFDLEKVEKVNDSKYSVSGNFTLRGVTKLISFEVDKNVDNKYSSSFSLSLSMFGINYVGVNDLAKVDIAFEI